MDLTTLFCSVDDFCKNFIRNQPNHKKINAGNKKCRNRSTRLSTSEIMTIVIYFQESNYRNFKAFYLEYAIPHLRKHFPDMLSYCRFVTLMPRITSLLAAYLQSRMAKPTGIAFIDATKIEVCNKKRISKNKVFKNIAKIGKTSMGWFFGFKVHIITNHVGELLSVKFTKGNINDSKPAFAMAKYLFGSLFGDKGYISKDLTEYLNQRGITLITPIKRNMKNKLLKMQDKILLRKRSVIETVNDLLKNTYHIQHTRHRSAINFIINIMSGLVAYTFREIKPSITGVNMEQFSQDPDNMGFLMAA